MARFGTTASASGTPCRRASSQKPLESGRHSLGVVVSPPETRGEALRRSLRSCRKPVRPASPAGSGNTSRRLLLPARRPELLRDKVDARLGREFFAHVPRARLGEAGRSARRRSASTALRRAPADRAPERASRSCHASSARGCRKHRWRAPARQTLAPPSARSEVRRDRPSAPAARAGRRDRRARA